MLLSLSLLVAHAAPPAAHLTGSDADGDAHPYVVAVAHPDDGVVCSGVVIAPRAVLTTDACAELAGEAEATVFLGPSPDTSTDAGVGVDHVDVIPEWLDPEFAVPAVLVLESDLGVDPVVIRDEPLKDAFLGTPLTLVGYGTTTAEAEDGGTRRAVAATAALLDPAWVFTDPGEDGWCYGDQGGAMLVDGKDGVELVAQITGGVTRADPCVDEVTFGARTDAMVGFLTRHGALTEASAPDTDAGDTDDGADADDGCGCATGASPTPLLALPLLGLARRRRR